MDAHESPRIQVLSVSDTGRRRRWTDAEKLRIVDESHLGGSTIAEVARRHKISRSMLYDWRYRHRLGQLCGDVGFLPEREVMTGIGTVPVQVPRVGDRGANEDGSKIRFRSALVPPYLHKAKSVEELLPWLYMKGISTRDFSEALAALLRPEAEGLSASPIMRLKATWWGEYETWRKRDLSGKRYVYIWAPSRQHALHAPAG